MGLDMYLIKRKKDITSRDYWNFDNEEMYWRKANEIHKFFCDNCEEIEEGIVYKVTKDNLLDLLGKCNKILEIVKTKKGTIRNGQKYNLEKQTWEDILEEGIVIENEEEIKEVLPTQSGFFFGSTDYDEYYLERIKNTQTHLEMILSTIDFDIYDMYYLASW